MKQRQRMFWTLGTLATSMTAAAALLHRFDPYAGAEEPSSPERARRIARSIVHDDVVVAHGLWHAVEILSRPGGTAEAALSASSDPTESHFYIDGRGRVSRSWRWRKQTASPTAPTAIRIQVSSPIDGRISANQWYAVQAILDTLDASLGERGPLPVRTSSDLRQVQFFSPASLPQLSRQANAAPG